MTQTLEAVFDGKVLCPREALDLEPNTRVRIVVESLPHDGEDKPASFVETVMSLNLDGPPDWSQNVDKYLYTASCTTTMITTSSVFLDTSYAIVLSSPRDLSYVSARRLALEIKAQS